MLCLLTFLKLYCITVIQKELINSQLTKEHFIPVAWAWAFGGRERPAELGNSCFGTVSLRRRAVGEKGKGSRTAAQEQREELTSANRWRFDDCFLCIRCVPTLYDACLTYLLTYVRSTYAFKKHLWSVYRTPGPMLRIKKDNSDVVRALKKLTVQCRRQTTDAAPWTATIRTNSRSNDPRGNAKALKRADWATRAVASISSQGLLQSLSGWFGVVTPHTRSPAPLTQGQGQTLPLTFCSLIFIQPAAEMNPDIWE